MILPLKPNPIAFQSGEEVQVELGNSSSTIMFKNYTLRRYDGTLYQGPANLYVSFINPQNRDSLMSAPVDFDFTEPDGEIRPLITYGAIGLA